MTLPSSGPIGLDKVNAELGLAPNTAISLGQSNVRTLAAVASGAIGLNNLYGKSAGSSWNPSITPEFLSGNTNTSVVTTSGNAIVGNNTGGVGPFTFSWVVVTEYSDGSNITATTGTGSSTTFRATFAVAGQSASGYAYCTVTDTGNGNQAKSTNTVTIDLTRGTQA